MEVPSASESCGIGAGLAPEGHTAMVALRARVSGVVTRAAALVMGDSHDNPKALPASLYLALPE